MTKFSPTLTIPEFIPLATSMPAIDIPRLPVPGWQTFSGNPKADLPCVLDAPNLLLTTSGRAATALALQCLGIGPGDQVLVPTYHCPTMVAPVVAVGAAPLFFSLDKNGGPDLERLAQMDIRSVKVMIAAHYFGLPQPMAAIRSFCDSNRIKLIEDCAHSMFGISDGQPVGSWGDFAIASLTKFLPVAEGGCLISSRHPILEFELASRSFGQQIKAVADHLEEGAWHQRFAGFNRLLNLVFSFKRRMRGQRVKNLPYSVPIKPDIETETLTEFAPGSLAWSQPTLFTQWLSHHSKKSRIVALRRRNYAFLSSELSGLRNASPLFPALPELSAPYVFPLQVMNSERYYQRLRASGIPIFRWDWHWPATPHIEGDYGWRWASDIFQIGCHQDLSLSDLKHISDVIKRILQEDERPD